MKEESPLSQAEWQDLKEQIFVLLDIAWDYSVNVATLEQMSVRRERGESLSDYNKRAREVYNKRFQETKADSFDRVVKVLGYIKKLGLPRELWPKEMEIKRGSIDSGKK